MEHDLYYFSFSILVLVLKLNLVHELNMTLVLYLVKTTHVTQKNLELAVVYMCIQCC